MGLQSPIFWSVALALLVLVAFSIWLAVRSVGDGKPFDLSQAQFVGRQACVRCHANESENYVGSHHDLAMDPATPATVLGDFSNAELTHHGITSRMFRDGDRTW